MRDQIPVTFRIVQQKGGEELHNFATIVQANTTLRNSVVRTGLTVAICIASYREDAVYTPSIAGVLVVDLRK